MTPGWLSRFELKPGAWVFVPTVDTIATGREIKQAIQQRWQAPSNYFHLQNGGHVAALRSHIENSWFVHLDIKDFFGSINRSRVTRALKPLFGYVQARAITNGSTVIHPERGEYILPFGFVQSPIISSICLYKSALGHCLQRLGQTGVAVSVYVDDIILSAKDLPLIQQALEAVKHSAERARFRLNDTKEEGPADKITAFNIDLSTQKLAISSERLAELVASYQAADSSHKQMGILGYVASVSQDQTNEVLKSP